MHTYDHEPPIIAGTPTCETCGATRMRAGVDGFTECLGCGSRYAAADFVHEWQLSTPDPADHGSLADAPIAPPAPTSADLNDGDEGAKNRRRIAGAFAILAVAVVAAFIYGAVGNSHDDSETSATAAGASSAPGSYTPIATKVFRGSGDDVIDIGEFTSAAILTFRCGACSGNTVVQTDGRESLLVNTIGSYSGSHFINIRDNSMTTKITVTATSAWDMSISDITTAPRAANGNGDAAILINQPGSKAQITNRGGGNFVVQVYSLSGHTDLAVNEIGSYQGTVPVDAPAFIQVESEGAWSIALG